MKDTNYPAPLVENGLAIGENKETREKFIFSQCHEQLWLFKVRTPNFATPVVMEEHYVLAESPEGAISQATKWWGCSADGAEKEISAAMSTVERVESLMIRGWGNDNFNK